MRFHGQKTPEGPATDWPAIHTEADKHDRFVIDVRAWSEEKEVSDNQFAYLHKVVFRMLADAWNCSKAQAELDCKRRWGEQWMIKNELGYRFVLSKTVLTTKQCNDWIDNIWEGAHNEGIIIPMPDKDWGKKAEKEQAG